MATRPAIQAFYLKRQAGRVGIARCRELIESPVDLGTAAPGDPLPDPLELPARLPFGLGVSFDAETETSDIRLSVNGLETIHVPGAAADQIVSIRPVAAFAKIEVTAELEGTVKLYARDQLGRFLEIANGVFAEDGGEGEED